MSNIIDNFNGKSLENMSSDEKMDFMIVMQMNFENSVVRLEEKDKERDKQIQKITKELDDVGRIVRERMKIEEDVVSDIKKDMAIKIRQFCKANGLLYQIWSRAIFNAAYGEIKKVCKAGSLTRILFSKTDLAVKTGKDMVLDELDSVQMLLVEARINDGKRFKVDAEKKNYLYETIRYHIVVKQDWQTVTREEIFREASINEANDLKNK